MTTYHNFIGIDIGKYEVVTSLHGSKSTHTFSNNPAGFKKFLKAYKEILPSSFVVLETTGGYEMDFLQKLMKRQVAVHRANTLQVKSYIRSWGVIAKSDALDAQALARYGFDRHQELPLFEELDKPSLQLMSLAQRRLDLRQMMVQEKNRMQAPNIDPFIGKTCKKTVEFLQRQLEAVTIEMEKLTENDELKRKQTALLQEIPGVGKITALMLIALLPELGRLNRRQIASLCGLAPHPQESGTKTGYRRTKGGRKEVRSTLFMAGITAARSDSKLGVYYRSLVERGKKKMVALVALMRKIIVIANSKMKELIENNKDIQTMAA